MDAVEGDVRDDREVHQVVGAGVAVSGVVGGDVVASQVDPQAAVGVDGVAANPVAGGGAAADQDTV